ncbi:MAG: tRNA pseudouridine(55) synthase TruB [Balneolaceae bacterium]
MAAPLELDQLPVLNRYATEIPEPEVLNSGAIIPVNKPSGWSSFQVVKFFRNRIGVKKVGHGGTLDPLATGLLLLCAGKATRSVSLIHQLQKVYRAHITLGASTPSYDGGTEFDESAGWEHIRRKDVEFTLKQRFKGRILQRPPAWSALKKEGKRYYKLAREGKPETPPPREVDIYSIRVLRCKLPVIEIEVVCGKGTYIRSIAHDLGLALESRAWLSGLQREAIGVFSISEAWTPESFDRFTSNRRV